MKKIRQYVRDTSAIVAVLFGLMVPVLIAGVGMSVDLGQAYLVRERLSHAIDAAALAAAASSSDDPAVVEQKVRDFVDANYPPEIIGGDISITVTQNADSLSVVATVAFDTTFMKLFGEETIDVYAETEVQREVKAIEVALVMDVTGSMATNNNIATLRTAATNFVNIMFERTEDTDFLKIGLVPFSTSVNVGPYGLGKTLLGSTYGTAFMNNPKNRTYDPSSTSQWGGCVLEGAYPLDTTDHTGNWNMYRYCQDENGTLLCDYYYDSKKKKNVPNHSDVNYICPETPIVPLTNNQSTLLNGISGLQAKGNTYINIGLVWGLRLLSPEFPFQEGVSWTNEDWKKAVILMTDGVNVPHQYYSVYGPSATAGITTSKLNTRVLEVCDELKSKNVLVYTITFDDGVDQNTKALFEDCATQPSMWYDAPTQSKLIEVYGIIAKELSNLHITK